VCYWLSSALNPAKHVWKHDFDVKEIYVTKKIRTNPEGLVIPPQKEVKSIHGAVLISSETASAIGRTRQYDASTQETQIDRVSTFHFIARNTDPNNPQEWSATIWSRIQRRLLMFVAFAFNKELKPRNPSELCGQPSIALGKVHAKQSRPGIGEANTGPKREPTSSQDQDQTMTSALWTSIALTGKTQWARTTNIAPDHEVWNLWLDEASKKASPAWSPERQLYVPPCSQAKDIHGNVWVQLPKWDCQERLSQLFGQYDRETKQKYTVRHTLPEAIREPSEALTQVVSTPPGLH